MERMWSPWRSNYIQTFKKPKKKSPHSIFTKALRAKKDEKHLIVWRGKRCFVIMNRYPYNSGHVMIVPMRQVADFADLHSDELLEIMQTSQLAIRILDSIVHPHGYNLGTNLGRVSGAGVEDHVHFHIVPRWNGDTNFMPVLADTKVISEDMKQTFKKLRKAFKMAQTA